MSQQEDFSKPRSLAASLFRDELGDFELPENSNIHKVPKNEAGANVRQSKYQQDTEDDFLDINLGFQSNIASRHADYTSTSSNSINSQQSEKKKEPTATKKFAQSRVIRKPKKAEETKPQVDIDKEIGEVAEWGERGAKHNSDDQDFDDNDQADKIGETKQQIEIRKKLEEKLKGGFNNEKKQVGGLKAKAEQLKKENEAKAKLSEIKEESFQMTKTVNDTKPSFRSIPRQQIKQQANGDNHNTSTTHLVQQKKASVPVQRLDQQQENEDDIDDHWNKINNNTINQITAAQEKRKNMTLKSVLNYYEKEFKFDQTEIDDDDVGLQYHVEPEEEQEVGCLASFCACFKSDKKPTKKTFNTSMAKRLVAISKKHLSNGDEEYFVLKEIWTKLTSKEFIRYGGHWNEIGFQGRDPATDLRSTGVLSLLQWIQFIEAHPKLSEKYCNWSIEHEYPLALTFIKLTGAFLDLLSRGIIIANSWNEFQECFNCLVWGMFGKMIEKYKLGDTLGNLVEEQAKQIKKQYKKLFVSYQQQFKKVK